MALCGGAMPFKKGSVRGKGGSTRSEAGTSVKNMCISIYWLTYNICVSAA